MPDVDNVVAAYKHLAGEHSQQTHAEKGATPVPGFSSWKFTEEVRGMAKKTIESGGGFNLVASGTRYTLSLKPRGSESIAASKELSDYFGIRKKIYYSRFS